MFNKKMLLSVLIIGVVSVVTGSTTWAYFQDTEISDNNSFTAGTLDLNLTNAPFTLSNLQPGDSGVENQTIENVGSLNGSLSIQISDLNNIESNGTTEFENDSINGLGVGELGEVITMGLWLDSDGDGIYDIGELALNADNTTSTAALTPAIVNSYIHSQWGSISMPHGQTYNFTVDWDFPLGSDADNTTQGDSVSFDVTFILDQS